MAFLRKETCNEYAFRMSCHGGSICRCFHMCNDWHMCRDSWVMWLTSRHICDVTHESCHTFHTIYVWCVVSMTHMCVVTRESCDQCNMTLKSRHICDVTRASYHTRCVMYSVHDTYMCRGSWVHTTHTCVVPQSHMWRDSSPHMTNDIKHLPILPTETRRVTNATSHERDESRTRRVTTHTADCRYGGKKILRLFLKLFQQTRIIPMGFTFRAS